MSITLGQLQNVSYLDRFFPDEISDYIIFYEMTDTVATKSNYYAFFF